jgi:hypothetical protein
MVETCVSTTLPAVIVSSGPGSYYTIFEGMACCGNESIKFARIFTVSWCPSYFVKLVVLQNIACSMLEIFKLIPSTWLGRLLY